MFLEKLRKCGKTNLSTRLAFLIALGTVLFLAHAAMGQEEADSFRAAVRGSGKPLLLPALLDFLLLAGILACFVISIKVKSFLRDGELASGWNLFSISFVLLFVAQILSLSSSMGLLSISVSIVSSLRLLFVIFLASGIYFMKRVLS